MKSTRKLCLVVLGIVMSLTALWGGGYVLHILPTGWWPAFPTMLTFALVGLVGVALTFWGVFG